MQIQTGYNLYQTPRRNVNFGIKAECVEEVLKNFNPGLKPDIEVKKLTDRVVQFANDLGRNDVTAICSTNNNARGKMSNMSDLQIDSDALKDGPIGSDIFADSSVETAAQALENLVYMLYKRVKNS